jgi:cardiolipin synthase
MPTLSREVARELHRHEDRYLADSEMLDLEKWRQRAFVGQVLENGARLLSPLL